MTFLSAHHRSRGEARVTLSPVGGEPLAPGTPLTLDFSFEGSEFGAGAVVERWEGGELLARLSREPVRRPVRGRRLQPAPDSVVASFVAEGTGVGRSCLPVLDLDARGMRLQSSLPFELGTVLRQLKVSKHRTLLREGEGIVLGSDAVVLPHGALTHQCRVRFRPPSKLAPGDDPADLHRITEPERVRAVLWGLCDLSYAVTLRVGERLLPARLEPLKGSRQQLPVLRCQLLAPGPEVSGAVRVECTLYGSGYRFFARVTAASGSRLELEPAPVLFEWHRREEERLAIPPELSASVRFRHPLSGAAEERRLLDLSVTGFGCEVLEGESLWAGLPVEQLEIRVGELTIRPPEATVRSVEHERCGFQFGQLDEREADRLRVSLTTLAVQPIELHDGNDLDEILDFHREVGLFEDEMARNLTATLEQTRSEWRIAHQHPDGLMRTAVLHWRDGVGATLSLVRAYDSTWVLQHSAVASPAVPANPGALHSMLVRLAIARGDGQYVCGFIAEGARSQHTIMSEFFSDSTPEYRGADRFVLYTGPTRRARSVPSNAVRKIRPAEEPLVENAALRLLDPVCARALGLLPGQVRLPHTRADFARVGLSRGREAWGAWSQGRCSGVLLREWASPGLCLSSVLSAGVLLPVTGEPEGLRALAEVLLTEPLPGDPPVRLLFVPEGLDDAPLLAAGLRRTAGCTLYAMHRYGLREYQRYVSSRYGFLHGRLHKRITAAA